MHVSQQTLKMAMVGGGTGSFIGPVHQLGAQLSGRIELVAGVFSSDPNRSLAAAAQYGVAPERCYRSHEEMFAVEARRDDGIDLVAIATPNHLHLPIALAAIEHGVHIISDKPATATLAEAVQLRDALRASDRAYALTFSYTAYPMVREARARVANGDIGRVRKVIVTYSQGWMASALERNGHPRAAWRTDPSRSGVGGCSADLGVHAFNLAEYLTHDVVTEMLCDVNPLVPDRALDDDCNVLLHFAKGGVGVLMASQVAFGERNGLSLQIYGDAGALHWSYDQPDALHLVKGGSREVLGPLSANLRVRVPLAPGIGNGLIAPFSVLYRDFASAIAGNRALLDGDLPGIEAGVRSMRFVETAVAASAARAGWTAL
ncbi:Gfo/Idh/MocA family protein [Steroidobacter flavus]|uniref:Gfo/Idh/MocA family protein n=1 Tax=Steroidobacter flavus TaxID=1842136 RepID=A0ABV8SZK1_9GAMM